MRGASQRAEASPSAFGPNVGAAPADSSLALPPHAAAWATAWATTDAAGERDRAMVDVEGSGALSDLVSLVGMTGDGDGVKDVGGGGGGGAALAGASPNGGRELGVDHGHQQHFLQSMSALKWMQSMNNNSNNNIQVDAEQ